MAKNKSAKKTSPTHVESIRHRDKRKNIPTEELRDFVTDDEHSPKTMLYPRDPSLDPQLVWKGKDEQDALDLAVPVVPIYIQEKIHPQAIIDDLRRVGAAVNPGVHAGYSQLNLFSDFNGGPADFEQKVEFYQHEQNWSNRLILGDSLLVMTSLAEKEGLKGKVQTIYLDPPYGIKFGSNWQVSTRKRDVKDGKAEDASRQPEQVKAFRDTWQLGIHSYLAYLRDRLVVARELLTETGSIFVQIGDENVHLVRSLMDEVFGSENFSSLISYAKTTSATTERLPGVNDYLLWYAKNISQLKYRQLFNEKEVGGIGASKYTSLEMPDGTIRPASEEEQQDITSLPNGARLFTTGGLTSQSPGSKYPVEFRDREYFPTEGYWKTDAPRMQTLIWARRVVPSGNRLRYVRYLDDSPVFPITNSWTDIGGIQSRTDPKVYVVQTATNAVERCLLMTTDPGDLVLDPTCGSGTTAYVAEQWGRRWITCDTSRVALALARTRLMAARYPYYLLADSPEGLKKERLVDEPVNRRLQAAMDGEPRVDAGVNQAAMTGDIKKGFVYKRVPHVTLKSIANNPDIQEGMTRDQIDAAIARHAETETLFDQPYEDNKRVRVCGPFSVESLSPHRTISVQEKKERAEVGRQGLKMRVIGPDDFGHMVLDNLRKAGVQNTRKNERLKFDTLDPYAGEWIHGQGTYTENPHPGPLPEGEGGVVRRAAICIGPEHGTVGAGLIKEAAKEAVKGVGFDLLVVCGFAFDPSVSEEAKRYGKLVVLPTKMNPDLAMGDELLKKTGAGNLFMVFGEPDVEIRPVDGPVNRRVHAATDDHRRAHAASDEQQIVVEIKGLDVYDPTTGAIRNSSTDDIACWFIDTDYNGESFFVRHAYFTGAEEPYDKLKRALRADIDEAAWSSLYSTTSRPFARPASGRIAVKVINHYGDEVLKIFEV